MKLLPRLLFALTLLLVGCTPRLKPEPKPIDMTPQRRASHMVEYFKYGRPTGLCTATAIGPHALMTANHCDADGSAKEIQLDLALTKFHIQKILHDNRDHDIYLIDGQPLRDFVEYKVRLAKMGEHVHFYGNGEGEYPSHREDGVRIPFEDPSEIDQSEGISQFDILVRHGDSGSAKFADDDSIVAVTTYLWTDDKTKKETGVDFLPGFTDDQITEALTFAPDPDFKPVEPVKPPPVRPPSFFDFFTGH